MNIYSEFFENLKVYLIKEGHLSDVEFSSTSEETISAIHPNLPLAYKEWLQVFGGIYILLNYPMESYSLEELSICLNEDDLDYADLDEVEHLTGKTMDELIFISSLESLYIFIEKEGSNPNVYLFSFNNPFVTTDNCFRGKFTTHIKQTIFSLTNQNFSINELPLASLFKPKKQPMNKGALLDLCLSVMEKIEENEDRIITYTEFLNMWNIKEKKWQEGKI